VVSAEIGLGVAVLDGIFAQAEEVDKDGLAVGSSDSAERVKQDGRLGRTVQVGLDLVKVEDALEQVDVVLDLVDDLDVQGSVSELADLTQVELQRPE
jgi:hypothetical protein